MQTTVPKIGVISLGCAKNRIDTEVMIGLLREAGYEFVQNMSHADVVLINTCSFIADATEEAIGAIMEAGEQKRYGSVKGIVVAGCLPQRYSEKLRQLMPEADVLVGTAGYKDIVAAVDAALNGKREDMFSDLTLDEPFSKRVLTTIAPTAYVKIAEGCDNKCSYCVIPSIRGAFQSRPIEDIRAEVQDLASRGYSEIVLVAQDTSKYGVDLYGKESLAQLLDALADTDGLKWLRVLYTYPEGVTDELLSVMAKHDTIVKYLDVPMQHMNNHMLRRMNRHTTKEKNLDTIRRIRKAHPDFIIRSTFIVGFPGETRDQFLEMVDAIGEAKLDRVGVFPYSREEGTPAARMSEQIDDATKGYRRALLMDKQAPISYERNSERVGRIYDVLIEDYDPRTRLYIGRTYAEIPDADGVVYVHGENLPLHGFCKAKITRALHYDCQAQVVPDAQESGGSQ